MKSNYVRKYDYLQYFYRPKSEWFIDDEVITDILHERVKNLSIKNKLDIDIDEEDLDENEFESKEIDSYEYYQQLKDTTDVHKKLDLTNPKVCEGQIIDEKSREYIKKQFPNCKAFDLSKDNLTNEQAFAQTLELIKENNNVILFQSVFIYTDPKDKTQKAIAKPDAIVKNDGKLVLIETKGTTSTKFIHLLDIYYQKNIINEALKILENEPKIDQYKLCIVKYEKCLVHDVTFVLVDRCNFGKNSIKPTDKQLEEATSDLQKEQLKQYVKELINDQEDFDIYSLLNKGENIYFQTKKRFNGYIEKFNNFLSDENKFWEIINELFEYQPIDPKELTFQPCKEYKSEIKDTDYWTSIRDYYYISNNPDLFPFQFSGNLIDYKKALLLYSKIKGSNISFESFLNEACKKTETYSPKNLLLIYNGYLKQNSLIISNGYCSWKEQAHDYVKKLRNKKVYFDFESLNSAIRVVDGYYPFMQTVNQVSVIFDHGDSKLSEPVAIVIDPKDGINKQHFKQIIDAILPSKNLEECKDYHYVVFNDGFEVPRLNEMANYIDEKEYYDKVNVITSNIFDIAEWFTISAKRNDFVVFKELKGFYSIKKVLPLVEKYKPEIFKQTGCKNYKTELTKIQNGSDAQNASTRRFFNKLTEQEWEDNVSHLKEYCNNDVRAMIAVEYLVKEIMSEHYGR